MFMGRVADMMYCGVGWVKLGSLMDGLIAMDSGHGAKINWYFVNNLVADVMNCGVFIS